MKPLRILAAAAVLAACAQQKPMPEPAPEKKPEPVASPAPVTPPPAPAPAPQPAAAPVRPAGPAASLYFDYDKSDLSAESRAALQRLHDGLPAGARIRIEGNCDERGSREYNLALGQRRADAARKYLVRLGADAGSITTLSYGNERPKAPGHDEASWRENRRDDIFVVSGVIGLR